MADTSAESLALAAQRMLQTRASGGARPLIDGNGAIQWESPAQMAARLAAGVANRGPMGLNHGSKLNHATMSMKPVQAPFVQPGERFAGERFGMDPPELGPDPMTMPWEKIVKKIDVLGFTKVTQGHDVALTRTHLHKERFSRHNDKRTSLWGPDHRGMHEGRQCGTSRKA
jgi:hypothetical protein